MESGGCWSEKSWSEVKWTTKCRTVMLMKNKKIQSQLTMITIHVGTQGFSSESNNETQASCSIRIILSWYFMLVILFYIFFGLNSKLTNIASYLAVYTL